MQFLILYTTEACHLCEQAKSLIFSVVDGTPVKLREIDIADDENLMAHYGHRIPVIQNPVTGAECGWPFNSDQIEGLI